MEARPERLREVCTECGRSYPAGTRLCPTDGKELMSTIADPLIGAVLPRRYRVQSLLGRGSMSVVYRGIYEPLDQPVAIKMLKSHLVSDPQQAKRFQQEIKTAGTLNHPNIVGILDFGVTEQGIPYLIMEYLGGKTLSEILDAEERLSVHRIARIFCQAADALSYAHHQGIVHRDIKPSNIVVYDHGDERDIVKIVDFGIAKLLYGSQTAQELSLTTNGEVLGTPLYMSPEQANGRKLDWRSDIYALGCVMYHAITGQPPFLGDTALDTIRLQTTATAVPIDQVRPDLYIPERLQSIVNKAMQKDPRIRYQRMEHLKSDLELCARRTESSSVAGVRAISIRSTAPAQELPVTSEPSGHLPWLALCLGGLLVLGGAAFVAWKDVLHKQAISRVETHLLPVSKPEIAAQPAARSPVHQELPAENPNVVSAESMEKEAALKANAGDNDAAEKLLNEALALRQKSLGDEDPSVADTLCALGSLEYSVRKGATAEMMFKNALQIRRKAFGENNAKTIDAYERLGNFYADEKQYQKAVQSFSKAIRIQIALHGRQSEETLKSVERYADIMSQHHRAADANRLRLLIH